MKNGVGTSEEWCLKKKQSTVNSDTALCVSGTLSPVHGRGGSWWHSLCPFHSSSATTPCVAVHRTVALSSGPLRVTLLSQVCVPSHECFSCCPSMEEGRRGWIKSHLQCSPSGGEGSAAGRGGQLHTPRAPWSVPGWSSGQELGQSPARHACCLL